MPLINFILDEYEPTTFSYEISNLWNFEKKFKERLTVTDLDWNPLNNVNLLKLFK